MKIYDKAQWHVDAGENQQTVLERFQAVFEFLQSHEMLSAEGIEIYELGIDDSVSLHQRLLTPEGNALMERAYDTLLSLSPAEIKAALQAAL